MGRARILIVDDHPTFRAGLRAVLDAEPNLEVVGEAADARATYRAAGNLAHDLMLIDVTLPGTNGLAIVRELRRRAHAEPILMLSVHAELDVIAEAISAGANGYLHKTQTEAEICDAVRAVLAGQRYLPPAVSPDAIDQMLTAVRHRAGTTPRAHLSPRQREIFDLLVRGYSNKQIASELFISAKTVDTHRTHIFRHLNVHSIGDLVRLAARHRLLPSTSEGVSESEDAG